MLNVVIEELGFGREQRRERAMSTHIPYLRHVSDTVVGLESGAGTFLNDTVAEEKARELRETEPRE